MLVLMLSLGAGACADEGALPIGGWKGPHGEDVPETALHVVRGPRHCEWQSMAFLHVGWPLGTDVAQGNLRQYLRDPEGVVAGVRMRSPLDLNATLPEGAFFSGYRNDSAELWLAEDQGRDAVYLRFADHTERWPRPVGPRCAAKAESIHNPGTG